MPMLDHFTKQLLLPNTGFPHPPWGGLVFASSVILTLAPCLVLTVALAARAALEAHSRLHIMSSWWPPRWSPLKANYLSSPSDLHLPFLSSLNLDYVWHFPICRFSTWFLYLAPVILLIITIWTLYLPIVRSTTISSSPSFPLSESHCWGTWQPRSSTWTARNIRIVSPSHFYNYHFVLIIKEIYTCVLMHVT